MSGLYSSPLRVYLLLGTLAFAGIFSGFNLPISLFPNSSKPAITVYMNYGNNTPEEFLNTYGWILEARLHALSTESVEVDKLTTTYEQDGARIDIDFKWGTPNKAALKEVETAVQAFTPQLPEEIRNNVYVWTKNDNSGFLAVSFFSEKRGLDELYEILEPVLMPAVSKVPDSFAPELWNPSKKEIRIELNPQKMAVLQLFPKNVDQAINSALGGFTGGSITMGTQQLPIQMPSTAQTVEDLNRVIVTSPTGKSVQLADISKVDLGLRSTNNRAFKTNGNLSLILFADPRAGGNVKRMSEDILRVIKDSMPSLPKDIQYKVLVDPSEFIRGAIKNVIHEVMIGALLAVLVLFLFIGSFKNTVTAAIEIPLSMVMAFILMKLSKMNINLISLGGLALSAGMNVDGSVVVMENIFRHFEEYKGPALDYKGRLRLIRQAVSEVRFAVIASTVASLVVFLPLAFTSALTYAVLGDLAKTVVFSHGFSAVVALILVPTVRLQLMSRGVSEKLSHSPIEAWIRKLEQLYASSLKWFIQRKKIQLLSYICISAVLFAMTSLVIPKLPKEIIGKPDTDWIRINISTSGNTILRQMESQTEEIEAKVLNQFAPRIQYTFTQVWNPNYAAFMVRLKDKHEMKSLWKDLESALPDTPFMKFWVTAWNPAELPIPDPPQLRLAVRGGTLKERAQAADSLSTFLQEKNVFPRISTQPNVSHRERIILKPNLEQWAYAQGSLPFLPSDLADIIRVATTGRKVTQMSINSKLTDIFLRYPQNLVQTPEDIAALPVGVNSKLIPLKGLSQVKVEDLSPAIYREDEREVFVINGRKLEGDATPVGTLLTQTENEVENWRKTWALTHQQTNTQVYFEDAEKDLHEALYQLGIAVGLSVLLIFVTLVLQFGDVMNAILVLVAIPLGFIGVLTSLFIFHSSLSLNSVLGVILLNGIAVANSIILVDFLKRLVDQGLDPVLAAAEAGRKRLRPILITSLTTILGMLPVALGIGEGGRILQPLGIAVSGGLWVSMGLTLFVVPALQVLYLQRKRNNRKLENIPKSAGLIGVPAQ